MAGRWTVCLEGRVGARTLFAGVRFAWRTRVVGVAVGVALRWVARVGFFSTLALAGLRAADDLDLALDFVFFSAVAFDTGQATQHASTITAHTRTAVCTGMMELRGENMSSPLAVDSDHDLLRSPRFSPQISDSFFTISLFPIRPARLV